MRPSQGSPGEETAVQRGFPRGDYQKGADELMGSLRTFIDTKQKVLERWGPPLVDADWHDFCQATYKGTEGQEWEELCCHCKELHQAAGTKNSGDRQKAKTLSAMKAGRDRDDAICDPARKNDIQGVGRTPQKSGGSADEGVRMLGSR